MITLAVAATALGLGGSAGTTPEPAPYAFSQQHRDDLPWWDGTWEPQLVLPGSQVTIQLPGDPITWEPQLGTDCQPTMATANKAAQTSKEPRGDVEYLGVQEFPNDGRIPGTATIYSFNYRVQGQGTVAICLTPDPPTDDPTELDFPPGSPTNFVLTLRLDMKAATHR